MQIVEFHKELVIDIDTTDEPVSYSFMEKLEPYLDFHNFIRVNLWLDKNGHKKVVVMYSYYPKYGCVSYPYTKPCELFMRCNLPFNTLPYKRGFNIKEVDITDREFIRLLNNSLYFLKDTEELYNAQI